MISSSERFVRAEILSSGSKVNQEKKDYFLNLLFKNDLNALSLVFKYDPVPLY